MPGIEEVKIKGIDRTWKQQYEGIKQTGEEFDKLNQSFAEYVQQAYDLSDAAKEDFKDFLSSLDDISKHWEDINEWVDKNVSSLQPYGSSLSSIRDLFSDISRIADSIPTSIRKNANLMQQIQRTASDAVFAATKEEGLSEKAVKSLAERGEKQRYLYLLKLREFDRSIDENTTLKDLQLKLDGLQEVQLKKLEATNQELRNQEATYRRTGNILEKRSIARRIAELQKEGKEIEQNIELTDKYTARNVFGLEQQLKLQKQLVRSELGSTQGIPKQIREQLDQGIGVDRDAVSKQGKLKNAAPIQGISLLEKVLRGTGLGEVAEDLQIDVDKFVGDRTKALEDYLVKKQEFDEQAQQLDKTQLENLQNLINKKADSEEKINNLVRDKQTLKEKIESLEGKDLKGLKAKKAANDIKNLKKELDDVSQTLDTERQKSESLNEEFAKFPGSISEAGMNLASMGGILTSVLGKGIGLKGILSTVGKGALSHLMGGLSGWAGALTAAYKVVKALWDLLGSVSEEAAKLKQHIGTWSISASAANTALATSVQWLETGVELAEKFKINPVQLFSPEQIGKLAEAKNLLGLTSEQAVNLGARSKIAAQNSDQYRIALTKGINAGNGAFKTAVGLGDATRAALDASDAIVLSMGNNAEKIGRAAVAAASLGMELRDVEGISQNLINFESSIQAEMQAQLLTGKQLNLAKAREYALNNNLEGVSRELLNQGIQAADWGQMNVIQQTNLAKALGMSRDQMARMLVIEGLKNGLSKEALAAATQMSAEQIEALGVQERMKIAVDKLKQSLVPILEFVVPLVEAVSNIVTWLAKGISVLTTWGQKKDAIGVGKKDRFYTKLSSSIGSKLNDNAENNEGLSRRERKRRQKELRNLGAEAADMEGVQTAGMVSFNLFEEEGKAAFAKVGQAASAFLLTSVLLGSTLPKIIRGVRAIGSVGVSSFRNLITAGQGTVNVLRSIFSGGLKGQMLRRSGLDQLKGLGQNRAKAAAGTGATEAAGKTAQAVKGKGSNLPKLGRGIAGFLKAFEKVTWKEIGLATVSALAFAPVAAMTPFIALASVVGPLASKGLPALGRGIAGFFKAAGNASVIQGAATLSAAMIAAIPALLVITGAAIGLAFALRLLAPTVEALGNALSKVFLGVGFAVKSILEGIATVTDSLFTGLVNVLNVVTAEKAGAVALLGVSFLSLATGLTAVAGSLLLLKPDRLESLLNVVQKVGGIFGKKRLIEVSEEKPEENKEAQGESIQSSVQELVIKEAQVQASAQQISIEQKAVDLERIEKKIEGVTRAIASIKIELDSNVIGRVFSQEIPGLSSIR